MEFNPNVTEEQATSFANLIGDLVKAGDTRTLARMVVAALMAMSGALHMRSPGQCEEAGGCVHGQEFGYTLFEAFASGKSAGMLANMELVEAANAVVFTLATLADDESELSTPQAVLEEMTKAFRSIEADPDGWEEDRRRNRDLFVMEAFQNQLAMMAEATEPPMPPIEF